MPIIASQIKPRSAEFRANAERMRALVEDLKQKVSTVTVGGEQAARAYYWLAAKDPKQAIELAKALYKAYFADDVNIAEAENVVKVAAAVGCSADEVRAALNDQAVKDRTRVEVEAALAKGVFGSPYVLADGEPFWGVDRFDQLERWLATGGW